ncbi:Reticulon-1-A RTN1.1 [Collichthys lucidus]|uniref:Reticulon n=1 Tax=Collichthys lucidus TaxID=240159 RepID=A0A4U5VF12_COLLU|nr:Reticulon-1-A RTN1.1 [Collichthys lucidus]
MLICWCDCGPSPPVQAGGGTPPPFTALLLSVDKAAASFPVQPWEPQPRGQFVSGNNGFCGEWCMYSSKGTWIPLVLNELCLWFHSEQGGVEGAGRYRRACLFGIQRCLLVESKDGRHHYAAHSSTAKIRAGRLADSSERKSKKPKRPQPQFSLLNLTLTLVLVVVVVVVGEAAGSAEVKQAPGSSHGNGPMFPVDTDDCQREDHVVLWSCNAIDLLYWRNVKQSGAVFSSVLLLLFSLTQFSVVSVGAYLALAALSATISFRIYKSVLQAVQKTDEGHPFKSYLEMEIALSQDQISKYADKILLYTNTCMKELRRLFLVQDLVDSLKFAVLMWLLTYVGALFNGLTLLILAVVSMFTMPVVYEKHQAQIDQYVGLIRTQVNSVVGKIQAKIPGAKRKEE